MALITVVVIAVVVAVIDGMHIVRDVDVDVEQQKLVKVLTSHRKSEGFDGYGSGVQLFEHGLGLAGTLEDVRFMNWVFIYPGTKWCGAGNIAENYDDLGEYESTDKCCRKHDLCDDIIDAYQTNHNLTNDQFVTKLNCKCDLEFYECLKSINKRDSLIIGNIYFNALGQQCFKDEYPIKSCQRYVYFPIRKCTQYELDETKNKEYQWFDVPAF